MVYLDVMTVPGAYGFDDTYWVTSYTSIDNMETATIDDNGNWVITRGGVTYSYGAGGGIMVTNASFTPTPEDLMPETDTRQWCPRQVAPETATQWGYQSLSWILVRHDHSDRHATQDPSCFLSNRNGKPIRFTYVGANRRAQRLNEKLPRGDQICPDTPDLPIQEGRPKTPDQLKKLTKAQLITMIMDMGHDWQQLNMIHNSRAMRSNWCGEYESNQRRYNSKFKVLKLLGRNNFNTAFGPRNRNHSLLGFMRSQL